MSREDANNVEPRSEDVDKRSVDDQQRRDFLKKLAAITSGVAATSYVKPEVAFAQDCVGLSPAGRARVPQVIVKSLLAYIAEQDSPDEVVLWLVTKQSLSEQTAIFLYDQVRAAKDFESLNELVNGSESFPGLTPQEDRMLRDSRAAICNAAVTAAEESKWPWED